MKFKDISIGQKVWVHNGEFPVELEVVNYFTSDESIELEDGHEYDSSEIFPTETKCKAAN